MLHKIALGLAYESKVESILDKKRLLKKVSELPASFVYEQHTNECSIK